MVKREDAELVVSHEIMYLDLGPACNLRCRMCRLWAIDSTPVDVQPLLCVAASLLRGHSIRGLQIIGGEPFCDEAALLATLTFGRENHVPVSFVTNGTLCDRSQLCDALERRPSTLAVSLDAADASVHDRLRGMRGAYARAIRTLKDSIVLRRDIGAVDTWIIIINVLNSHSILNTSAMVELAESLGVDGLVFQPLVEPFGSSGGHHQYYQQETALMRSRAERGTDMLLALQREHPLILNTAEDIQLIGRYLSGMLDLGSLACDTVTSGLVIHADAGVSRCFCADAGQRVRLGTQDGVAVQHDERLAQCKASCKMLNCNRGTASQLAFRPRRS